MKIACSTLYKSFGFLCLVGLCSVQSLADDSKLLTIGSDAPKLDVEHWIHADLGRFPKVTKFEKGQVYVVEFWATWCGPCIDSMPHLVELQTKYADKGVQIISISDEPLEDVQAFLEREVRTGEDETTTFNELTKAYSLTTDPDRSSNESYLEAARQGGIPCAFLVGKDSKIEWIGHPQELDEPLELVVTNKWDRDQFGKEFLEGQRFEELGTQVQSLVSKRKSAEAIQKIDDFIAQATKPKSKFSAAKMRLTVLRKTGGKSKDISKTIAMMLEAGASNPMAINEVGWTTYELYTSDAIDSKESLRIAIEATKKAAEAVKDDSSKSNLLDTLAHLQFASKETVAAIETQQQAVALADESDKEQLEAFLQELRASKDPVKK